ncbi:type 2 lantipeptide synthetase LanM [Kordia sp. TARA_039_SRF]|nr:type 2 lantipeptide synthetase LanM [Kordia sp. TARA_039_SRF]
MQTTSHITTADFFDLTTVHALVSQNSALRNKLLQELNRFMYVQNERILYDCFDKYKAQHTYAGFSTFVTDFPHTRNVIIKEKYPHANTLLTRQETKLETFVATLLSQFAVDKKALYNAKILSEPTARISDINIGLGDFHHGKSTTIIEVDKKRKVVYKPSNGGITTAYHAFLNWISTYLDMGDFGYKTYNKGSYHWQEFVTYESLKSPDEIANYYYRAGILLAVTYVLNASDFHYENLIVHNGTPILIDHETIIQPKIYDNLKKFFKAFDTETEQDTVLSSLLLPNQGNDKGFPVGMCGFGCSKETHLEGFKKMSVHEFTDDWKIVTKMAKQDFIKNNVPEYQGEKQFVDKYTKELLAGFEACYQLFIKHRDFLLFDKKTPVKHFDAKTVRFIWRPTNVYVKILEYMKLPKNLTDKKTYTKKIEDYLSVAFKNVPKDSELHLILKSEIHQMLQGDVPYFEIDASSRDLKTEFGVLQNFFEFSCVENLERKLQKLSSDDLAHQKKLILQSIAS